MKLKTRKLMDQAFSGMGFFSVFLLSVSLIIVLTPIFSGGIGAFIFKGTVEFRRLNYEKFNRGSKISIDKEMKKSHEFRQPIYQMIRDFENQLGNQTSSISYELEQDFSQLKQLIDELLGPAPSDPIPVMVRDQYGSTRWDKAQETLHQIMNIEEWDYSNPDAMGKKILKPRIQKYNKTPLKELFPYLENNLKYILLPKITFYWQFLIDESFDAHLFGGIGAEILGTLYLILGTMIFAIPMGVIAAIYLAEFAKENSKIVSLLRVFISTLAGVPSIVFGLFGLAFFINTIKISNSKSVLAGSMTLALLVLPTIIRSAEEAIRAVPKNYKEAALSLGASKIRTILTIILPAALPGILTGIVISMGRAAGETAPIIFTAAVSVGNPLNLFQTLNQPTPALSWNIYNLATEHEAVEQIRHVQFGMVFTLVLLVLLLNLAAIILRAKISKKIRG